jgi:hypothetical protein
MSDEPKTSRPQLRVLITDPLVRRWTIGGAIVGFVVSTACMIAMIVDRESHAVWELAWLVVPVGSTLHLAGCGFCLGYLATKSKRRNAAL